MPNAGYFRFFLMFKKGSNTNEVWIFLPRMNPNEEIFVGTIIFYSINFLSPRWPIGPHFYQTKSQMGLCKV